MKVSTPLFFAVALAVSAPAGAQQGSSLEVTVDTGLPAKTASPSTSPKSSKPAAASAASKSGARSRGTLSSRGGRPQLANPAPTVVTVRPGTIIAETVKIRAGRDAVSSVLSTAAKGQNLAVLSEVGGYYGVLMMNNTMGWVPKDTIQLMDYATQVTMAAPPPEAAPKQNPTIDTSGLNDKQQQVLREAFTYMGVPYVWAGNGRSGLDCSAFVKNVFSTIGVTLPRHSGDQLSVGQTILDTAQLVAGDRLYFAMKGGTTITHTGIYIGQGYFIHASSNHKCVDVDPLFSTNYIKKLVAIRRD